MLALPALALTGCNDFLDEMPDSRATLDSEEKIQNILVSAYNDHDYCMVLEMSSDNTDWFGDQVPNSVRWFDDAWRWKDETETLNESLSSFWSGAYISIASANQAITALGEPTTDTQREILGEALMCRAYHHFMLVNIFCREYSKNTLDELGIPYMDRPETQLSPKYQRGTVGEVYEKIQKDIEAALPLVGDSHLTIPKYHFNVKAAYAFACRFYLFTEQWEKAVECADKCLGSQPATMLRDWAAMAKLTQSFAVVCNEFISPSSNANLLLSTSFSRLGVLWGPYTSYGRYNHGAYLSQTEDMRATQLWGSYFNFRITPKYYQGSTYNKVIFWKTPYLFEYIDPVAGIGYNHSVVPVLTSDETILNRAEALIMLNRYDEAAADLTLWMKAITKSTTTLTPASIQTFYNKQAYSYEDPTGMVGTLKKHIAPGFQIDAEGSVQECMLQCVLGFRRIETIQHGLRWFDIKRYGIEIPRRLMDTSGTPKPKEIIDWLRRDDNRRALQLPSDVISAGLTPNPR